MACTEDRVRAVYTMYARGGQTYEQLSDDFDAWLNLVREEVRVSLINAICEVDSAGKCSVHNASFDPGKPVCVDAMYYLNEAGKSFKSKLLGTV